VSSDFPNIMLAHHDRRPAMWPWLLMPLVALALYFALHSVRESAPRDDSAGAVQTSAPQTAGDAVPQTTEL